MTQVEFENQLRELRSQKAQVMNQFSLMQNEVKEEIAAKNRQIYELSQQVQKLKVQKAGITERRLKAEKDWGDRIQGFINQYQEQANRSWEAVSTYTIVKELRKRGWQGTIFNNDPDMAEEHKDGVIAAFNGKPNDEIPEEELTEDEKRIKRMAEEYDGLCGKFKRLLDFLETDKFKSLPEHYQALLKRQARAMDDYESTLKERIQIECANTGKHDNDGESRETTESHS